MSLSVTSEVLKDVYNKEGNNLKFGKVAIIVEGKMVVPYILNF